MNTPSKVKLEPVYLDDLNTQSKDYKVRVTVIEKGRPQPSPKKPGVIFQTIILEDEKQNKMRCALFGDQIHAYEDVLKPTGQYEISKAPITYMDDQYKMNLEELPYQMTVGQQTIIQRLNPEAGPIEPKYQPLSTLPRSPNPNGRYDIIGVVLFVEDAPRMISNIRGRDSPVREISVTDTSQDHAITISAWNDLTGKPCDEMSNWAERFNVVGFTALKTRHTRGFGLNTTMSTRIIMNPKGERADMLREWAKLYQHVLLDRQEKILNVRYPSAEKKVVTIAELRSKKASNTIPDEVAWIKVTIPDPDLQRVNAYIGCAGCGKRTHFPVGTTFPCISCKKPETTAAYRVTFKFDAVDESGSMSFTAFNDDTERLFRKKANEIWNMKSTGNLEAFAVVHEMLSTRPFYIQVTPTQELAMNSVLLWALKSVAVEDDEPVAQSPVSMVPMTCTTNTEQPYALPYATTAEARGKAPLVPETGIDADINTSSTAAFDEAFAEAMQFREIRLASQAFDADCFEISDQPANKGIIISEPPTSTEELPTWAKLSRPRSNSRDKEPMSADMDMDAEDEDHPPRKKLRTALFKDSSKQVVADNKNTTPSSLSDA